MHLRQLLIFLALGLCGAASLLGQANLLDQPLQLKLRSGTEAEFLNAIEKEAGIDFAYGAHRLKLQAQRRLRGDEKTIRDHLETVLEGEYIRLASRNGKILLAFATRPLKSSAQPKPQTFTLSGYVREAESGESLMGAAVYTPEAATGTYTNEYGFFSLTLPKDSHLVAVRFVGYAPQEYQFPFQEDQHFDFDLESNLVVEEVEITDGDEDEHEVSQMGRHTLSLEKESSLPVLMGEMDVLKTMKMMPGVHGGQDGIAGFFVRGGGADQNLMTLDGVPIYNANHALGVVSVFNSAALNSASITKGGLSARYGGRLSALVDVRMKEGNQSKLHGELGMGLLSGSFMLEGPLKKEKTSFMLAARRSWFDLLLSPIQKISGAFKAFYFFHDLNLKINHKFSNKDRVYLSGYLGKDRMGLENIYFAATNKESSDNSGIQWGNYLGAFRWNHIFNPKLFSNATFSQTRYHISIETNFSEVVDSILQTYKYRSLSSIQDWAGRLDFEYFPSLNHHLSFGAGDTYHNFRPTDIRREYSISIRDSAFDQMAPHKFAHEAFAYIEDDMRLSPYWKARAGLHLSVYQVGSEKYFGLQPRLSLRYLLNKRSSLKASYSGSVQYSHYLVSYGIGLPLDLWVPSTEKVRPESSGQLSIGYYHTFLRGFKLSAEVYYKEMNGLLEYKDGFNFFNDGQDWETKVEVGRGWSYGGEILLRKTKGRWTGWLGYGWSRSDRLFENLNGGKKFPFRYDRRHDLDLALTWQANPKLSLALVWVYGTGNALTLGRDRYQSLGQVYAGQNQILQAGDRNNFRAPAYHRLDLSVNLDKVKKHGHRRWSFGLYNAYAQTNPDFIFVRDNFDPNGSFRVTKFGVFPLLPFARYQFKF